MHLETIPAGAFATQYYDKTNYMTVELLPDFTLRHWTRFENFYRQKVDEGVVNWDLDLRQLLAINSLLLGLLIGLNTDLRKNNGCLRLRVDGQSEVAGQIYESRVNRIITVCEVSLTNDPVF